MRKAVLLSVAALLMSSPAFAAEWKGKISDSMCGVTHPAGEHGGKKTSEHDCTESCVKGGAKYVFVSGDKVYKIANQDLAALKTHSGEDVTVTGEMKGDTVTISKIAAAPAKQ